MIWPWDTPERRRAARRDATDDEIGQEIEDRYAKEIAAWEIEHQTRRQDWSDAQWRRFQLWRGVGQSTADATQAWYARTHEMYGRFLLLTKRISDEVPL